MERSASRKLVNALRTDPFAKSAHALFIQKPSRSLSQHCGGHWELSEGVVAAFALDCSSWRNGGRHDSGRGQRESGRSFLASLPRVRVPV